MLIDYSLDSSRDDLGREKNRERKQQRWARALYQKRSSRFTPPPPSKLNPIPTAVRSNHVWRKVYLPLTPRLKPSDGTNSRYFSFDRYSSMCCGFWLQCFRCHLWITKNSSDDIMSKDLFSRDKVSTILL